MNRKVWDLFKQSEEYRRLIRLFDDKAEDIIESAEGVFDLEIEKGGPWGKEDQMPGFLFFANNFEIQEYQFDPNASKDDYIQFIDQFELYQIFRDDDDSLYIDCNENNIAVAKDDYRVKNSYVSDMSLFFYYNNPFFKPILFVSTFYVILRSCRLLGIDIPALPKHRDYRGAMIWYYDLCLAFKRFQDKYGLSDPEFCACLYGLGDILHDEEADKELPRPVNVWMTGASKDDYKSLEKDMSAGGLWQCNENTRRGDIVVLYAVSPHSCIHSIWRADSEGSFNPFDYRQCRTQLTDGIKVTPITLQEMKDDPTFGTLPMLNNNLQGIGGKMLPSWAYSALLKMIEAKGDDMTKIPVLFEAKDWNPGVITDEKDVENKILVPALHDLGYKESDWTRQLRMKSGRKEEREIPDFVFFPHGQKQFENAPFLIEAKLHMGSEKDRKDAYRQALSYARMLQSGIFGICDDEKLIIFEKQSDGSFYYEKSFERKWASISSDIDTHAEIMSRIGASVIKSIVNK